MNKKPHLLLIPVIFSLSSCGFALDDTYDYSEYNSPIFDENYYTIKEFKDSDISKVNPEVVLNETNKVFLTYNELKEYGNEMDSEVFKGVLSYKYANNSETTYGTYHCLSSIDESFSKGILSKLTDGLLFCDGRTYQRVRVQINESGFTHKYEKECQKADYFAVSFKSGSDFTSPLYGPYGVYNIKLHIDFYNSDGNGKFIKNQYSYLLENNNRDRYQLFGFKMDENMSKGLRGIGIYYELLFTNEDPDLHHTIHLYETIFANSIWH